MTVFLHKYKKTLTVMRAALLRSEFSLARAVKMVQLDPNLAKPLTVTSSIYVFVMASSYIQAAAAVYSNKAGV